MTCSSQHARVLIEVFTPDVFFCVFDCLSLIMGHSILSYWYPLFTKWVRWFSKCTPRKWETSNLITLFENNLTHNIEKWLLSPIHSQQVLQSGRIEKSVTQKARVLTFILHLLGNGLHPPALKGHRSKCRWAGSAETLLSKTVVHPKRRLEQSPRPVCKYYNLRKAVSTNNCTQLHVLVLGHPMHHICVYHLPHAFDKKRQDDDKKYYECHQEERPGQQ